MISAPIETLTTPTRGGVVAPAVGPILLAVDGAPQSELAARAAADLARAMGQALHVVHCWLPLNTAFGPAGQPPVDFELAYADPAREILHAQVAELRRQGANVAGEHLLMGRVSEQVPELAEFLGAQLIVTGSRGLGAIKRLALGSISEDLVHSAPTPVLVVRGDGGIWPPEQILVGDDGSDQARIAAETAAAIARATGAELTIATVFPQARRNAVTPDNGGAGETLRSAGERMTRDLADQLGAAYGIAVRSLALVGDPAATLLSAASSGATPAMVAVGSRGLGAIDRITLGSVSTKVLHGAHGAVLISHLAH